MPGQIEFPYVSLDFPGVSTVRVLDIAARTGFSHDHIFRQIEQGLLTAIDARNRSTSRKCVRVPIEEYRAWVMRNLTGPSTLRSEFLDSLPKPVLRALHDDISRRLTAA